ncbi:transcriptional regulator [Kineococcus sp. SYSU DK005]|uniref:transcriptional regulator n=1 Tax=Kineococcus sp. SYSU DK005 TaxID=3383126 RepID=UPI003D7EBCD0
MSTAPEARPDAQPDAQSDSGGRASTSAIDEFLHTPARLNICSLLAPADWVAFSFLRDAIGTSDSALSKQVAALEQAGYVEVRKERSVQALRRQTSVRLTAAGRTAFDSYLATLELLVARARGGL